MQTHLRLSFLIYKPLATPRHSISQKHAWEMQSTSLVVIRANKGQRHGGCDGSDPDRRPEESRERRRALGWEPWQGSLAKSRDFDVPLGEEAVFVVMQRHEAYEKWRLINLKSLVLRWFEKGGRYFAFYLIIEPMCWLFYAILLFISVMLCGLLFFQKSKINLIKHTFYLIILYAKVWTAAWSKTLQYQL